MQLNLVTVNCKYNWLAYLNINIVSTYIYSNIYDLLFNLLQTL